MPNFEKSLYLRNLRTSSPIRRHTSKKNTAYITSNIAITNEEPQRTSVFIDCLNFFPRNRPPTSHRNFYKNTPCNKMWLLPTKYEHLNYRAMVYEWSVRVSRRKANRGVLENCTSYFITKRMGMVCRHLQSIFGSTSIPAHCHIPLYNHPAQLPPESKRTEILVRIADNRGKEMET